MISINSGIYGYEDVIRKPLICTFFVFILLFLFFFLLLLDAIMDRFLTIFS